MNKSFLRAFYLALSKANYISAADNVDFFTDIACRAPMRQVFLRDEDHGSDMACVHFLMIAMLYMSMVKEVPSDLDSACRFTTWASKRFIRYHFRCFQLRLREFATQQINEQERMLLLPACMNDPFIDTRDIHLVSYSPKAETKHIFHYKNPPNGFVMETHRRPKAQR